MGYNQTQAFQFKKSSISGFTFIELVVVMIIVSVLSVSGAHLMSYLIQNSVFIPNKLNMDMLASDALNIMIEGDPQAKGLRFSRVITNVQDYEMTFVNQDSQTIRYHLDTGTNRLYRYINGVQGLIPYYVSGPITIAGSGGRLFSYYDTTETSTSTPANVRRIEMTLIAQTGTGSYDEWEGESEQSSSITVKKFQ